MVSHKLTIIYFYDKQWELFTENWRNILCFQLEENQAEIRNMLTYIFKGVFVHRYRYSILFVFVVVNSHRM
jgi:hypothetical protein